LYTFAKTIDYMANKNWVSSFINKCEPIKAENLIESQLVDLLVKTCYDNKKRSPKGIGILLSAAYDLVISAEYYTAIAHSGWLYCPEKQPRLFFPYTNCCPCHAIKNEFFFHPSNKPTSGKIGTATSRILLLFYQSIFRFNGMEEQVLKGTEPVDAVVINRKLKKVLFAEIKASPLLTLALTNVSDKLTKEVDGEAIPYGHETITNTNLYHSQLEIFVPKLDNGAWQENYYSIGQKNSEQDIYFGFRGLINLLNTNENFFTDYFDYWCASLNVYYPRDNKSIFWLTNACGTPSPVPPNWQKRRVGSGYESVSDSKTSVGMDRTDDIKKGIYQVLKLGAEGKPNNSEWDYKVGIISNIHPARHFDEYLNSLKNIVWTNDETGRVKIAKDLPENQPIYNLFDGIIALTQTHSRDEWIDKLFTL
jgi:hypothetical protein